MEITPGIPSGDFSRNTFRVFQHEILLGLSLRMRLGPTIFFMDSFFPFFSPEIFLKVSLGILTTA